MKLPLGIIRENLDRLDGFFAEYRESFDCVRPKAGPIAFPAFRRLRHSYVISNEIRRSIVKQSAKASTPKVSRPKMPKEYGLPKDKKGLLPWSHVTERMEAAKHYWIATSGPDGAPHATPVDGVWVEDRLYFGGSPQTKWRRNLAVNAAACIHLADTTDVVILHGKAHLRTDLDRALLERVAERTKEKYGYGMTADQIIALGGVLAFAPRVVLAWKAFPTDVTRWEFSGQ